MRRPTCRIVLPAAGGFALVLALMLLLVVGELTDYTTYDVGAVASLSAWAGILVAVAVSAFAAAIALARRAASASRWTP